jgi:predicted nucleotidyltransferase
MLTEQDIRRIVQRIVEGYGPIVVGTFGSYAIGVAHQRSDLDLLIIKKTIQPAAERKRAVYRLLFGILHPLDVQVFTPEEFQQSVNEQYSFICNITRQVRIYHWSSGAEQMLPSLQSRMA